jgi:hypothetical protein
VTAAVVLATSKMKATLPSGPLTRVLKPLSWCWSDW